MRPASWTCPMAKGKVEANVKVVWWTACRVSRQGQQAAYIYIGSVGFPTVPHRGEHDKLDQHGHMGLEDGVPEDDGREADHDGDQDDGIDHAEEDCLRGSASAILLLVHVAKIRRRRL